MSFRIALVTGAARGIGREIALRLAREASGVAVHYHRDQAEAELVAGRIREAGKLAAVFKADLGKRSQAAGLVKRVEDKFGRLDILVNNVGPFKPKPWDKLDLADWEWALKSNLVGAYFCIKAALPGMRERKWGRVVNIGYSRVEQHTSFPTILPYAAAKSGLLLLTRTAAVSEAPNGITVNMVSPGLIKGGQMPRVKELDESRLGNYSDVAEAVAYLASDAAAAVSGTNIIVAGTWKM
jgi:3-oxoacyl-[acyl-carrier protein] reductase